MIDTHCHLDFQDFDHDRDAVLRRCKQNGIKHIVVPAVSASTFEHTIKTCQRFSNLKLALGLHPVFIEAHQPQDLITLDTQIDLHAPVAVGEIGLDFYEKRLISGNLKEKQILFFTKQLIIANQQQLPVIIHNRKAHDECIELLHQIDVKGGIIHAFNGSIQQAQKYIEFGFALGFGGMLTFERSTKLRKLAKQIPLDSIVLETDAPDMTVAQHHGERNSPEYLPYIHRALTTLKYGATSNDALETVAQTTSANAKRVLGL